MRTWSRTCRGSHHAPSGAPTPGLHLGGRTLAEVMIAPGQLALAAGPVIQPAEVTRPVGLTEKMTEHVPVWERWDQNKVEIVLTALQTHRKELGG